LEESLVQVQGRQYLYKIVYDTLKQEILDGIYTYSVILPSEREISIRFDVDRTTVRKALELIVADGLVEKRAGVGTQVIYKPDQAAAAPLGKDKLVGFFIVENGKTNKKISQPFYSDLFYHVENQCKKHSANVIYSTIKNKDDLSGMISQRGFSGIIFCSKTDGSYVEMAQSHGIKVAQILGYNNLGLTIRYDSAAIGKLAIDYLVEKGHRDIALITGPNDFGTTSDRMRGILLAMYSHGLDLKRELIFEGTWERESGYDCTQQILARKNRPTAIYVFNDMMATGAMQAITDQGLKIPKDISLIGSDNMDKMRLSSQSLTTVDINIASLAEVAIDYFFNDSYHYIDGTKIIVPVTFVEGNTVQDLN